MHGRALRCVICCCMVPYPIQTFEALVPDVVNRRTLQRDLKEMLDKGILAVEGATHQVVYRLSGAR